MTDIQDYMTKEELNELKSIIFDSDAAQGCKNSIDQAPPEGFTQPRDDYAVDPKGIYADNNGRLCINYDTFVQWFIRHKFFFFVADTGSNRSLKYIYDEQGYYREVSDDLFKGFIMEELPTPLRTPNYINRVYDLLKMYPEAYRNVDEVNGDENIINCKNGLLSIASMTVYPHSPDVISTIQYNCNYYADIQNPDTEYFMNFIAQLSGYDADIMQTLMEFIALALSNIKGYRTKKSLFLVGKGNTGKSQYRKLLTELLGKENEISIDLETLESRFGTSQLLYKRLAGSNDMKFMNVSQLAMFKQLTGGDRIYAEKKGKDGFSMIYNGLLCFCTNEMPKFGGDRGEHVYDRFIIVKCDNVIPEEQRDPHIVEKMMTEKDFIFSLCISLLPDLIARNYKIHVPKCSEEAIRLYKTDNDSVLSFIEECTEKEHLDTVGTRLKSSDVYNIYRKWCDTNNMLRVGRKDFVKTLTDEGLGERIRIMGYNYYEKFRIKQEYIKEFYDKYELLT